MLEGIPKLQALEDIFDAENLFSNWPSAVITARRYLNVISQPSYSLKELGLSAQAISDLNKKLLPNRVGRNTKVCNDLLRKYGLKFCTTCYLVYEDTFFFNSTAKQDGKDCYCKLCFNNNVREYRRHQQATYRADLVQRVPKWANIASIVEIYNNCPKGYHVDHIIPLRGKLVSGLHVENNLQYLLAVDNIAKNNKFVPG